MESVNEVIDDEMVFADDASRGPVAALLSQVWQLMSQLLEFGYATLGLLASNSGGSSAVGLGVFVEDVVTFSLDVLSAVSDVFQNAVSFGTSPGQELLLSLLNSTTVHDRTVGLLTACLEENTWDAPPTLVCSCFAVLSDFAALFSESHAAAADRIGWLSCEVVLRRLEREGNHQRSSVVVHDAEDDSVISNAMYCLGKLLDRSIQLLNNAPSHNGSQASTLYKALEFFVPSLLQPGTCSNAHHTSTAYLYDTKIEAVVVCTVDLLTSMLGEIRETARDNAQILLTLAMRYDPAMVQSILWSSSSSSTGSSSFLTQVLSALSRQIAKQTPWRRPRRLPLSGIYSRRTRLRRRPRPTSRRHARILQLLEAVQRRLRD